MVWRADDVALAAELASAGWGEVDVTMLMDSTFGAQAGEDSFPPSPLDWWWWWERAHGAKLHLHVGHRPLMIRAIRRLR